MNYDLSIPKVYQNLSKVIELLVLQKADSYLVESVLIARNNLLAVEMMGIASNLIANKE